MVKEPMSKQSRALLAIRSTLLTYLLPMLSGLLIGTSYIPFQPWALFFCLVPLMIFWLQAKSAKQIFIGGWITQFILNLIGFHWISQTATEFGHFPFIAGIAVLIGFAAIAHTYYAFGATIAFLVEKRFPLRPVYRFAFFVLMFAICDRLFPMIFPWHLGYPWLWAKWPGAQFADVIGFEGLNIVTIAANALFAWAVFRWIRGPAFRSNKMLVPQDSVKCAIGAIVLVSAVQLLGQMKVNSWKTADSELSILAVQGNIGNFEKLMVEHGYNFKPPIVHRYIDLSRQGLREHPSAQIMIWPETAYPALLDEHALYDPLTSYVRNFLRETQTPLLTGAYSADRNSQAVYNGFFYLDSAGNLPLPPYRKTILLVFGETFPFSEYLPYMDKLFPNQGSFTRGSGPTTLKVSLKGGGTISVGPQICYEGLYPWFASSQAAQGAQIFTNVTNDSWFGYPFEPNQHMYMTLSRAIEFRRPLLRVTNTGITTAILASGEILQKSPHAREWSGEFKIPYLSNPSHTIYEKIGFLWPWVLAFSALLLLRFGREPSA